MEQTCRQQLQLLSSLSQYILHLDSKNFLLKQGFTDGEIDDVLNDLLSGDVTKPFLYNQEVANTLAQLNTELRACAIIPHHLEGLTRSVNFYHRYYAPCSIVKDCDHLAEIRFYDVDQPFGEFSNFSDHPVFIDGEIWRTVEHYYQSQKHDDVAIKQMIRLSHTPVEAKRISAQYQPKSQWNSIKLRVMSTALFAKFTQHSELTVLLLSTNNIALVETAVNDSFWGCGADGQGDNQLGKLLIMVRQRLQQQEPI